MRDRIRILVLAAMLALTVLAAPAHAWPAGDHAAVGWWDAVVAALAELFGLDTADGSLCIDPLGGCRDDPEPPSTPDGSLCIDPLGGCRS